MTNKQRWLLLIAILFALAVLVALPKWENKKDQTQETLSQLSKQEKELVLSLEYQQDVHQVTLDILTTAQAKVEALKLQASDEQAKIQSIQESIAQVQDTIIALGGTWAFTSHQQ